MPLTAGTRLGPYQIVGTVGAGGMGDVYRAHDARLGRDVAVKLMNRASLPQANFDRFRREARAASSLNHPNIVTIHEIEETETDVYIVMELVEGQTVREIINERPPLAIVTNIIGQVAQALAVAHKAGIVHRDIKPENIMVRADGYVKLLDFGLARIVVDARADEHVTKEQTATGALVGTLRYMSPEQATGEPVSSASDIFSLGLVLYELATGQHAFARDPGAGVLRAIISERAIAPSKLNPEIPASIDTLVLQMLQGQARLRPDAGEVAARAQAALSKESAAEPPPLAPRGRTELVGREAERAVLMAAFERAAAGQGTLVSVIGEPGIGKTALVEDFLEMLTAGPSPCLVARGRCSERLAGVEAYLPLLEVLDGLMQGPQGHALARLMKLLAPGWYAQIAPLSSAESASSASRIAADRTSSPERLKRELTQFLQEASREEPLVVMLDNVHWIDLSSTDVLAYLATRLDGIRLLIVACYREPELLARQHPFGSLKLDLEARGHGRELALAGLDRSALERLVDLRFPRHRFPAAFIQLLQRRTEGTPLFVSEVLRYLRDRKVIVEDEGGWRLEGAIPDIARELPDSVRSLIQQQIDGLDDPDRRLLVCASVQGLEFDAAVVARAAGSDPADVEERLEQVDRLHGLIRRIEEKELPDGTPTLRYRFAHVLYQNALYFSLTPSRRVTLSGATAAAVAAFYGEHAPPLELALLHEAARDFPRAADSFARAARADVRVCAYKESALLAERGLRALSSVTETAARSQLELELQLVLGLALTATRGYAAPEVERAYTRARTLIERSDDPVKRFRVLDGLWRFYTVKPDLITSSELAQQLLDLATRTGDEQLLAIAHCSFGTPLLHQGFFADALGHMNEALARHDPQRYQLHISITGADLGVRCHTWSAFALWLLGFADQAAARTELALARAVVVKHPFSQAFASSLTAWQHHFRREPAAVHTHADAALALSAEHSLGQWVPVGRMLKGWALAEDGQVDDGIEMMRGGLELFRTTGAELNRPHFLSLLAEGYARAGRTAEALATLDDALVIAGRNHDRYWTPEILRLKGVLVLDASGDETGAARSFEAAIEAARALQTPMLELRAATAQCRLWKRQRRSDAQDTLRAIHPRFTEGHDTRDLREAREELSDDEGLGNASH